MIKVLKLMLLLLLLFGCSSIKRNSSDRNYSNGIVYIIPNPVVKLASTHLNEISTEKEYMPYFVLYSDSGSNEYILYIINYYYQKDKWVQNTNRYVSINGTLYPLIFYTDYTFANTENAQEYLDNYKNNIYLRSMKRAIFDRVYHIAFKENGEVLSKGY
ncbi:hypothetical protein [Flavobacterium litorale]|uniref:Lipoprotein n=1 Tax=Flavobacterium litorale TaxID=2856519 RepID=A0ABX8V604_9FLAO|nr:hypothetical protein [Flavobacterium litorale]QYJ68240.1 hypothetical protein K1I41_12040 [Flavobacterium litorale]